MADPRPACPECYLVVRLCYTQTCNHACHGTGQREAPPPCLACGRDTHTTEHHHRVVGRLEALKEAPPASPETPDPTHVQDCACDEGGHGEDARCEARRRAALSRPRWMTNYHGEPCGKCGQFTVVLRCLNCEAARREKEADLLKDRQRTMRVAAVAFGIINAQVEANAGLAGDGRDQPLSGGARGAAAMDASTTPQTDALIAEFLDDLACILDVDNEDKVRPVMEKWRGKR